MSDQACKAKLAILLACLTAADCACAEPAALDEILVSASRPDLTGIATTASEGAVDGTTLALTPAYRPGQLLEAVPGLAVTLHSGEGKANQFLLRGYNLDHGTDLATFVDGMPVNEPSHAHGQGYTDLNFIVPELLAGLRYTKGPYHADEGDFASVGAVHLAYRDTIDDQLSVGAGRWGYERLFAAASSPAGIGRVLGAVELQRYSGPWDTPGDQHKGNALLRYSAGRADDGYSLTVSLYEGAWNNQTDVPARALAAGLIGSYGQLDPSDRGAARRVNLSAQYATPAGGGQLAASGYVFTNHLSMYSDFTHFLVDPVHGDQERQFEDRTAIGGALGYTRALGGTAVSQTLAVGAQLRLDSIDVGRVPTQDAVPLPAADAPLGFSERDRVRLGAGALYASLSTRWSERLRSELGLRADYQAGSDRGTNPGDASRGILEPKASLIYRAGAASEWYLSAGRGFHSDDLRGVNFARVSGVPGAPLIASQVGEEAGVRQAFAGGRLAATMAVFRLDAQSETTYNPDAGMDAAGPASRRVGYELNLGWQACRWLAVDASLSQDRTRFRTPFDDGTGHVGTHVPNAPFATGSLAVRVHDRGPWSGGLELRYLGAYPLSADGVVQGSGYHEWNADVRYQAEGGWRASLGIYNLLNTHADAMQYWYVDRLPGEPLAGRADVHIHPLEPIAVRVTLTRSF